MCTAPLGGFHVSTEFGSKIIKSVKEKNIPYKAKVQSPSKPAQCVQVYQTPATQRNPEKKVQINITQY